jgi:hypothetical protein
VTAVIVSSMGAVYTPSLKALQKVLKYSDQQISEVGKNARDPTHRFIRNLETKHLPKTSAARRTRRRDNNK